MRWSASSGWGGGPPWPGPPGGGPAEAAEHALWLRDPDKAMQHGDLCDLGRGGGSTQDCPRPTPQVAPVALAPGGSARDLLAGLGWPYCVRSQSHPGPQSSTTGSGAGPEDGRAHTVCPDRSIGKSGLQTAQHNMLHPSSLENTPGMTKPQNLQSMIRVEVISI